MQTIFTKVASKKTTKEVTFDQLEDAWWSIYEAYDAFVDSQEFRVHRTRTAFEMLLVQCGWSIEEWNKKVSKKCK